MKLTFSPASPFARKVRIAAIELGLIDRIKLVPTTVAPGQRDDEYSRITPLKKLPVLVLDNGEVILDSYVIVEYLDELAGGGKLIPASGPLKWKIKSDHSLLQGMLDSMLLCRYETITRPEALRWRSWSDDHWNRAFTGLARFEEQVEAMQTRSLDIAQIGLVCVLGYADFRFSDCGWRKSYPKLDAFHNKMLERPSVENLAAAGGLKFRFSESVMQPGFNVGDLTLHRIIEQEIAFLPALEMLPKLTGELLAENRAWLRAVKALDEEDALILCFQSYVVRTPRHTILVDTCIGNDKQRPTRPKWHMKTDDTYMRALAAAGVSVGDIDFVMCTHLHPDHVGWNTRLDNNGRWAPTFPNARYVFARTELEYWTAQNLKAPVAQFGDSVLPVVEANRCEIVSNDFAIGDHVRIVPTPGHTPGHVALSFGKGKEECVFSGDVMHSPLQTRYPELSVKFDADPEKAAVTRRNFLERYCGTETLCCTAHFPSPSVGKIRRRGNGFSCEAAS